MHKPKKFDLVYHAISPHERVEFRDKTSQTLWELQLVKKMCQSQQSGQKWVPPWVHLPWQPQPSILSCKACEGSPAWGSQWSTQGQLLVSRSSGEYSWGDAWHWSGKERGDKLRGHVILTWGYCWEHTMDGTLGGKHDVNPICSLLVQSYLYSSPVCNPPSYGFSLVAISTDKKVKKSKDNGGQECIRTGG